MSLEKFEYAQLVDKPKAKSKIWTSFGFSTDAAGMEIDKKIVCRLRTVNIVHLGNIGQLLGTYM